MRAVARTKPEITSLQTPDSVSQGVTITVDQSCGSCTHQSAIMALLPPFIFSKDHLAIIAEQVVHNCNTHRKLSCQLVEQTAPLPLGTEQTQF